MVGAPKQAMLSFLVKHTAVTSQATDKNHRKILLLFNLLPLDSESWEAAGVCLTVIQVYI